MTGKTDRTDAALDALFEAARQDAPTPRPDFMARLHADADAALPSPAPAPRSTPTTPGLLSRLGGYFAVSGLTGAAALGVWIGFVMPDLIDSAFTATAGNDEPLSLSAFLPGADLTLLTE